jgi:cysteine desulfurase/selenocysteine lyase
VIDVRGQFPALEQPVHGYPLAYLDSAAMALVPQVVIDAVTNVYARDRANIHRGVHALSARATLAYEAARERVAEFVHARPDEVVFCRGTTEALNLVAQAWAAPRLGPGDRIVVSDLEHHSNLVPWQRVAAAAGAEIASIPIDRAGELDLGAAAQLIDESTKVVAITHVSSVLGSEVDVARIAALAHDVDAICVVDGAQAVAHRPVDFVELGCDFYAFSGHKLYGPDGIGVLVGVEDRLSEAEPYQTGGGMIVEVETARSSYADPPRRFEAGTPAIAGAVGLAAAIEMIEGIGFDAIIAHEAALMRRARELLGGAGEVSLYAAPSSAATLSFTVGEIHPHDVATIADSHGVAIRSGHHCAQPLMARLGLDATARASFAIYNTEHELERLVDAIAAAVEVLG